MTELGAVGRVIIQNICDSLREANEWENTKECHDCFKTIKDKEKLVFIKYDIFDFYTSITEKGLANTLNYATLHVEERPEHLEVIFHCRK